MTTLKVNDKAPLFEGIDQNNQLITSSMYSGKVYVIYFYPKDNTPGCIAQACNLRDHYTTLLAAGVSVIGVSKDSAESHQKFINKHQLPFPLIADTELKMLNDFGVWGPKKFMGKEFDGIHRTTFIINEENTIVGIITKPKTKYHAEEILALLEK